MEIRPTSLTILSVPQGLLATKSFVRETSGTVTKLPTKMARRFTVERRTCVTIQDLASVLTQLSSEPRSFVIRGEPIGDTAGPVRRLKYSGEDGDATFRSSAGERWVCFDFDKISPPPAICAATRPDEAMEYLADLLPPEFHDVTFWGQWSSSSGINGWATLSAHLWFMLDKPVTDDDLWLWGKSINSPIDTRLFNSVQPHFTAAPIFAYDVPDPCPVRHSLIKGSRDAAELRTTKADDRGRTEVNPRKVEPDTEATRNETRPERSSTGSHRSQMGSGRINKGSCSNRSQIVYETQPLLSERLIHQFRQRDN
jgi:hypothetical protein